MHQPHADRNVPPISLSLINGGPCPDFRSGKGGREIENQGGSHTLLPVKQTSLCFSHTASSVNTPKSSLKQTFKPTLPAGTLLLVLQKGGRTSRSHSRQTFAPPRDNHGKTTTYRTRNSKDEPPRARNNAERQPTQTRDSIGSLFSPLRFRPVRPARDRENALESCRRVATQADGKWLQLAQDTSITRTQPCPQDLRQRTYPCRQTSPPTMDAVHSTTRATH